MCLCWVGLYSTLCVVGFYTGGFIVLFEWFYSLVLTVLGACLCSLRSWCALFWCFKCLILGFNLYIFVLCVRGFGVICVFVIVVWL